MTSHCLTCFTFLAKKKTKSKQSKERCQIHKVVLKVTRICFPFDSDYMHQKKKTQLNKYKTKKCIKDKSIKRILRFLMLLGSLLLSPIKYTGISCNTKSIYFKNKYHQTMKHYRQHTFTKLTGKMPRFPLSSPYNHPSSLALVTFLSTSPVFTVSSSDAVPSKSNSTSTSAEHPQMGQKIRFKGWCLT